MTTVYLTVVSYDYEGDSVLAVSSTREKALAAFAERCADPDHPGRIDCGHDAHFVEAWEVDGKAASEEVWKEQIEEAMLAAAPRGPE